MNLRDFLNLYILAALSGAGGLWTVAAASARFADSACCSPVSDRDGSGLGPLPARPSANARSMAGSTQGEGPAGGTVAGSESIATAARLRLDASASRGIAEPSLRIFEVTAYSHGCVLPESGVEGHAQRAANGRWPIADVTVAADASIPFGSELLIEGVGFRTVGDRGHAIVGRRLDLFVDSCREARAFGRRWLAVTVVPPATTQEAGQ